VPYLIQYCQNLLHPTRLDVNSASSGSQSRVQYKPSYAERCTYHAIPRSGYDVGGAYRVDHLLFNMHWCDDSSHHGNKHCRRFRCEFHNRSVPVPYNSYISPRTPATAFSSPVHKLCTYGFLLWPVTAACFWFFISSVISTFRYGSAAIQVQATYIPQILPEKRWI
jgi:hypothetical protein